ncbi:hypothetical protein A3K86_01485 [Photobacterium jeanii]|uniref:Carbohydrate deacetylase n=1 Tax=Photobacterium jeanii TaxID=858640 RepID=A0A178KRA6_9GAMM|nr:chitin disaccharide deacetylase [Photobacterium jeanii]OAN19072.1 hypothetical protein A3K86_01485 [Photobacterium jeanii]PST87738.1 chitin disaccharide deacetylase [Photobacterium jeanii]
MKLIFNADDFGLTPGVNSGTVEASLHGVVRSATMLIGMPAEQDALTHLQQAPPLRVGLHLRFTTGRPFTSGASLMTPQGCCWPKEQIYQYQGFKESEVADEIETQIAAFHRLGITLSHLDSHHHAHCHPQILPVVREIAASHRLMLRADSDNPKAQDCRYHFSHQFYDQDASIDTLLKLVDEHSSQCDVLEVMCHPAYVDKALQESSGYAIERDRERQILTDSRLLAELDQRGVELCDFSVFD